MKKFDNDTPLCLHQDLPKRIAFVHDWLVTYAGAERVLEQMLHVFPHADIFSLIDFLPEDSRDFIQHKKVKTSFLQKIPCARSKYRSLLPLMPLAIEQLDVSEYDIVISSSYAVAKGVLTGPDQLHLCMCYSPIRYAWDLQHQYLRETGLDKGIKGWIAKCILHGIRLWDSRSANGVDGFVAISDFIARRIWKTYRRESTVIYPPVDIEGFTVQKEKGDFYLTASRMVPYKRIDLVVEAFAQMPDKKLVVIGDGPDFDKIRRKSADNINLLGYQPYPVLKDHLQRAKAFVFAAEEDFGIAPLEAQACGTPVIAYGKGGALETIRGGVQEKRTGTFFFEQTVASLCEAVAYFEKIQDSICPFDCRENALKYSTERFRKEFENYVVDQYVAFLSRLATKR